MTTHYKDALLEYVPHAVNKLKGKIFSFHSVIPYRWSRVLSTHIFNLVGPSGCAV